jgi:tetratricopeptide (TPR) repeat protein
MSHGPRILTVLVIVSLVGSGTALAQSPQFQFLQRPGPHSVGLKVVDQYDPSRKFPVFNGRPPTQAESAKGRPLQTLIWYPAIQSKSKPMTGLDYVALADTEVHFDSPDPEHSKWRKRVNSSFDSPLWAVRDAKPQEGRYPIVIYAPSDSSVAWENADLCEYLASHGYIVLASRSMGTSTRDMTDDVEGINEQARDISFLITYAGTLSDADRSKVAVVSFSWGGISSLFAAARDKRIDALAELDGSMRYYPGLVKQAGDIHPEQMEIPLLFFTSSDPNHFELVQRNYNPDSDVVGPNVLNAWKQGDLYTVNMLGISHPEFCSMFQRWKHYAINEVADYGVDDMNTSYAWMALYTLKFLNAYLKTDASAKGFLARTPADNGVPKHFMGISFRAAASPGFEDVMSAAAEQGYAQVLQAYRAVANDPAHRNVGDLEKQMNIVGYMLLGAHENEAAVRVFRVNAESHNDANVFDSLGDGYSAVGDKISAIKAYQRSVELDPANEHAKNKIRNLQSR